MPMSFPRRELGLVLGLFLANSSSRPLAAQFSWGARLGATYTTTMVTDHIAGSTIELAPGISPSLSLEARRALHTKTPLEAVGELFVALGTLERTESGSSTRVAGLRTVAVTGNLRGNIRPGLTLQGGIGFLSYALSEKTALFQEGRPIRPLGTAALQYTRPLTPALRLTTLLRYDVHAFTTKQLEMNGYTGSQTVHRVMLGVGVSR